MGGGDSLGVGIKAPAMERYIPTGAGTPDNPMGTNPQLERTKGFKGNFVKRDISLISRTGSQLVFRTYTPKNETAFKKMAANPNFTAIRTGDGHLAFIQAGTSKIYLNMSKAERAHVFNPVWANGQMAVAKKASSFQIGGAGRVELAKLPVTVGSHVKAGHIKEIKLAAGGTGYKVAAEGANGDKAWNALHKAGFSYRVKVGESEVWVNQAIWQKMQRSH